MWTTKLHTTSWPVSWEQLLCFSSGLYLITSLGLKLWRLRKNSTASKPNGSGEVMMSLSQRIIEVVERHTPTGAKLAFPILCVLFGFVWGFVAHMSISSALVRDAYQQGYDKRDAEGYRGLHPISHLVVARKISDVQYDLESESGTIYHTTWCEPLDLEEGWMIEHGIFLIRGNCLTLQLDKGELKIDRTYHEVAAR